MDKCHLFNDDFFLIEISGASEILATTVAHHATTKVMAQELSSFEEEFSINDNTDSDDEDESKMEQKFIKGDYVVSPLSIFGKENTLFSFGKES